jgi:Mg-chelatase subunit ChlI
MNPEEGELRPQLLDRFGLCVEVKGLSDHNGRMEIIERRLAFERNPESFASEWAKEERELGLRIEAAASRLGKVTVDKESLAKAVNVCLALEVDGHRGDLTIIKTAMTMAAWKDAPMDEDMLMTAAELALPHRMRRKPFQDVDFNVRDRLSASKS